MNASSNPCPRCGSVIPVEAPAGVCPRCALAAVAEPADSRGGRNPKPPTIEDLTKAFPGLEFEGFLGAGGMGFVYRVRDRATGEIGALKVLLRELAEDPAFVERFEREARTLARLDHPGIVRLRSWGQTGGFCHLLMEHVEGANLREALRAGRFSPEQALALVGPLCDALQYAHSQGVLHRDIKPENILLDADGRAKIADFGIAKILAAPGSALEAYPLTQTGARIGTPHYMAPEQVEKPEAVDHRADIYSLGVVLYELLTGELPLGRFQAPSAKVDLDARIDEIVLRALAKERELRQQSAGEVRQQVEDLGGAAKTASVAPKEGRLGRVLMWVCWGGVALAWVFLLRQKSQLWPAALLFLLMAATFLWRASSQSRDRKRLRQTARATLVSACVVTAALVLLAVIPRVSTTYHLLTLGAGSQERQQRGDFWKHKTQTAMIDLERILSPYRMSDPSRGSLTSPPSIPSAMRIDPATRHSFLLLHPKPGAFSPWDLLIAAPPVGGNRLVMRGDGRSDRDRTVQTMSEREFWRTLADQGKLSGIPVPIQPEPAVPENVVESLIKAGTTVVLTPDGAYHPTRWPLDHAFRLAADGVFEPLVQAIAVLLQEREENLEGDWMFLARSESAPDAPPDFYAHTASREGGLLAILAVGAAHVGDRETLRWAQERGRALWADRPELVLFRRQLGGVALQTDWEEVRAQTSALLELPQRPATLTVIRHFKEQRTAVTHTVQMPWPRKP